MSSVTFKMHMARGECGRLELREGAAPIPPTAAPTPSRVGRLVGVAHRVDALVRSGEVADYADAARVVGVTRARMSQIVDLLLLAPDIQEQLLFLERQPSGRAPLGEHHLRSVTREMDWAKQRDVFRALVANHSTDTNAKT